MSAAGKWQEIARRIRVPLGFIFAALYLWFALPSAGSILAGAVVLAPGLLLRAAASGHLRKDREVTATGPYAHMRNPLYVGSAIVAAGFAVASRNYWIALAMAVIFVCIYLPVVLAEEKYLRSTFPEFARYAQEVPRFLPTFSRPHQSGNRSRESGGVNFSRQLYRKHREYNAALGAIAMLLALGFKLMWFDR